MDPVEISAGRLHLRPFGPAEIGAVARACADPEIARWIPAIPVPYTEADAERFVAEQCPVAWAEDREYTFAVLDSTTAELLAAVGLHRAHRPPALAEVGFWCAPWARRQRVTTRAVLATCRWAFAALPELTRIEWYAEVGNVGSRRVAEAAGFRVEGVLRGRLLQRDQTRGRVDAWIGSLLRGDTELAVSATS